MNEPNVCLDFLLFFPFSLIPGVMAINYDLGFRLSILMATIIGLVYIIMEDWVDYHENPFMGAPHAMPMLAVCGQ